MAVGCPAPVEVIDPTAVEDTAVVVLDTVIEAGDEGGLELTEGAQIAYFGAFDWSGASQVDGSYVFDNDIGFRFRVDQLYLAITSVQLRLCPSEVDEQTAWPRSSSSSGVAWTMPLLGVLGGWVSSAHADHVVDDDGSIVVVQVAEDALSPSHTAWGVGTADGGVYCQAFALSTQIPGLLPPLEGHTIVVSGAYVSPDTEASDDERWVPFEGRIPLTEGTLADLTATLDGLVLPSQSAAVDVDIVVTRYPLRGFDSLDPRGLDSAELAWEILGDVLHSSSVEYGLH